MINLHKPKNRREFLKDGLRAGVAGSIVFMGLFLGWRKKPENSGGTLCIDNLPCRDCSKMKKCTEPKALKQKQKTIKPAEFVSERNGVDRAGHE